MVNTQWEFTPTVGQLDQQSRNSLRRVPGISTELDDIYEVEYRQLRLERVVLVGVWTYESGISDGEVQRSLQELAQLARTAGSIVLEGIIQRRDKPDPATYIGLGKAAQLRDIVRELGADTVICDGELSGAQLTALEKNVHVKVIDRTALILDIFAQHATSREGKAQVSLAQMQYMLPRLRGWGESLSRQTGGRAGGVGLRGPGETKIETDRRRIRDRMAKLRREIAAMKIARDVKRKERDQSYVPKIAIIGYTNAGKSSLLNALSNAGVLVEDALFATLDPTTRRAKLACGLSVILTDTVGFVNHLPTQLVDAFTSTLEEILYADVLLHVVDGSDPMPQRQISTVRRIIQELVEEHDCVLAPEILVINKSDIISEDDMLTLRACYDKAIFVSATYQTGCDELGGMIFANMRNLYEEIDILIPYFRSELIHDIYDYGIVHSRVDTDSGMRITATINKLHAGKIISELAHKSCHNT